MTRLPSVKPKDLVRALERTGFYVHHQTGSHARLIHRDNSARRVTISIHSKEIPKGTLGNILRQSRLSAEELRELL